MTQIRFPRRAGLFTVAAALTAVAAIPAALFGGLTSTRADATAPAAPPPAMPVSVATVTASEVASWDEFSGRLEAVERVDIRSRAAGTVLAVHFREGALVRQGDLLFTIDPAPYAAAVERAEAQVVAARARVSHTKSEHERSLRLWDERAIAQRELDERTNALREAEASQRAALAALQSAQLELGYTQVRAPIAGRIGRIEVTTGNLIAAGPGAPVLSTLVSVSPIYASFDADEQVIVARALKALPSSDKGVGSSARASSSTSIPVQMGTAGDHRALPFHRQAATRRQPGRCEASGTVRVRAVFDNKPTAA